MDDDLRVGFCKRGNEWRAEEGAASISKRSGNSGEANSIVMMKVERDVLHAFRAAPFVAVVEIEAFALQDECTYAILKMDGIYQYC